MEWLWNNYGQNAQPVGGMATGGQETFDASQDAREGALLRSLEARLADIDSKLAAFDKANPGFNPDAAEIAAKRAEIGDFSAYDNMVGRQGSQNADPTGIENELYNAEKLTWGLKSKSGEEKEIAKANIEASLRRAEEWADKTGGKLPMSYHRLKAQLEEILCLII